MARKQRRPVVGKAGDRADETRRQKGATTNRPSPETESQTEGFYAELFTPEELAALAQTEGEPSLEDEIDLLRIAIRRGVAEGESLETISRSLQRLAQMLKVQRSLKGQSIRNLEEALVRVLDEIGGELGGQ